MNSIFAPFLLLGPSFVAETSGPGMHPLAAEEELTSSRWARGGELPKQRRGEAWMKASTGGGVGGQGGHRKGDLRQTEPGKILGTSPTKLGV